MQRRISLLVAVAIAAAPNLAQASSTDQGLTSQILTANNGTAFFEQNVGRSARPSCATATRWVIDVTTPSGQGILAHLLSINAQGRKIYVSGTGNCAVWGDSETVAGIMDAD